MKQLPEKWCVKRTKETYQTINDWANETFKGENYNYVAFGTNYNYFHSKNISMDKVHPKASPNKEGEASKCPVFEEISFEDFLHFVVNKKDLEIIGYICPEDLFGGEIEKGQIYVKAYKLVYYPKGEFSGTHKLPYEIVERWQPIYKEEEKKYHYTLSNGEEIIIRKNSIESVSGKHFKVLETKEFKEFVENHLPKATMFPNSVWVVGVPVVDIGCFKNVKYEELSFIYNKIKEYE